MSNAEMLKDALPQSLHGFEIAIVGMAGSFPGAADIEAFWRNIAAGVEAIRELSDEELDEAGTPHAEREQPDFVRRAAVLEIHWSSAGAPIP